ncbi:Imm50 family immunity protein [Streptomyces sp. CC208A]|uniref:Imm50 family immunity protein n=1 Tax=Streptomyces sp. CC208A TaxID=3044573 RepID=UPI0024A9C936|nr:Imm50 family immunity protein [Streptomyces sp. CC208A]
MSGSEWVGLLAGNDGVRERFGALPGLDACDLFHCLIDERGVSVTLGFDVRPAPPALLEEWREKKEANAFEFFLTFTSVTDLYVSGWGGSMRRSVQILRAPEDGGIAVTVESPTERLAFRAQEAAISRARTYLASSASIAEAAFRGGS